MTRTTPGTRTRARRFAAVGTTALTAALTVGLLPGTAAAHPDRSPVQLRAGLVGSTPAPAGPTIAGVTPGTAPWVLDRGRVRLDRSGVLDLTVRRLVIPTPPANGTNPVPLLSASLVCNGVVVDSTGTVPFSTRGNAHLQERLDVPGTCLAPAVLVHPGANRGVYIAATG